MSDNKTNPFWAGIGTALCADLPFILDSVWRRREFEANRLFDYAIKSDLSGADAVRRSDRRLPVLWMFIATLAFFTYGPTFDALCSVVGPDRMPLFRYAVGGALLALAARQLFVWWRGGRERANKRIKKENIAGSWRARVIHFGVLVGVTALVAPLVLMGSYHVKHAQDTGCLVMPPWPARLQAMLLFAAIVFTFLLAKRKVSSWRRTIEQSILFLAVGVLLLVIAPEQASEALQGPYPHVYAVLALTLAVIACVAPWLAQRQFRSFADLDAKGFRDSLATVELFPKSRVDPDVSWRRAIAAFTVGSLSHPLHLLLLPALMVLMAPTRWMGWVFSLAILASAILLMIGNLSSRWRQMVLFIKRWFLVGTPLAVSVLVIAMAALRLKHVQYVSTILDAAPFGAIFMWVAMAYALFWWFEYAVNGAASFALLKLLGTQEQAKQELIPYVIEQAHAGPVAITGRFIATHGAGRFAVMGWFVHPTTKKPETAFHTYELLELFSRLMPRGADDLLHDINRRLQLYFLLINGLVVAGALAYAGYYGHGDARNTVAAVVTAKAPRGMPQSDLAQLLAEQAAQHRPAIIVAASGGGTRAALFTATALEGLAKLGVAKDVVLLSGVSGGGVASAYFYGHRQALIDDTQGAWETYKDRMTEPFIGDVLDGAGEWRVVSAEPLGNLLAESFARRLFADGLAHVGDATRPALVLNTTITGHPQEHSVMLRGMFNAEATQDCDQLHRPYAFLDGGRLVFTNLKDMPGAFPAEQSALDDVRYPYVVVRDPTIPLARAAALNANFPPVFPNARVNIEVSDATCPTRSYYVTDGGATENLGLLSALYALRSALQELPAAQRPEIHIVAVEASATGYDYSQDRGMGAAAGGAKQRLVGGLTQDVLTDICAQTGAIDCKGSQLQLHYLSMPLAFRSRGGFGTHWMFPNTIVIENPRLAVMPSTWQQVTTLFGDTPRTSVAINRAELMQLWTALHDPGATFCRHAFARQQQQVVANWICGTQEPDLATGALPADLHIAQWQRLANSLASPLPNRSLNQSPTL